MNKSIILGVVALVVLLGGALVLSITTQKELSMQKEEAMDIEEMMDAEDGETMMEKEGAVAMEDDSVDMMDEKDAMMKAGSYEAYSPEKLARAETGDVVLFFHASWCPSCRGLNASIESGLQSIPEGVSILKVDYDKETELKKKYGVTYQHTLVQVAADGTLIKKWSGSPTLGRLVSEIQ